MSITAKRIESYAVEFAAGTEAWRPIVTGISLPLGTGAYFDLLDRMVWARIVGTGFAQAPVVFDPLFLSFDPPATQRFHPAPADWWGFVPGELDRLAGTQPLYGKIGASGNVPQEVNPLSFVVENADVWPNVGWEQTRNGKTNTTDGWYGSASGHWFPFPTLGYAICLAASVRFAGSTLSLTPIRVDLATGDAVPEPGLSLRRQASPNAFQGGTIFGDTVSMNFGQFVPDDDSTPLRPKGFLMAYAQTGLTGPHRVYMQFVDWNPTDLAASAGTLNRVHKRVRLITRLEFSSAAFPTGTGDTWGGGYQLVYHPPTRSLRGLQFRNVGSGTPPWNLETCIVVTFNTSPTVASITPPAARRDVLTGRVSEFASIAHGSLGERIAGVDLSFTLERVSTVEELLDTSGGAGSSSPLAQVADDDPDLQPIVYEDGVPLTVTTHYTVNYGTNEIDFVAPKPLGGSVYTASYRHRTDPASPPHGVLLNGSSRTDGDGEAIARVQYAQDLDLVAQLDRLQVDS